MKEDPLDTDLNTLAGMRKSVSVQSKLSLFASNSTNSLAPTITKTESKPFQSLYERTLALIPILYSLPDFEYYLFPNGIDALLQTDNAPVIDPISVLWDCFRLGAPLCHLYNQLEPAVSLAIPDITALVTNTNLCKKCVYHFLVAAKEELATKDELFSISELFKDDTNGFVKVLSAVDMVLDEMKNRDLCPPQKPFPFAMSQLNALPLDNRSKAIAELLSTERNYIESLQDLMVYQNEIAARKVVSNDILYKIFSNLPELLDFQRRFLFSLEATLSLPHQEQHIGLIFIQYEEGFQVYNAMCASYSNAIVIALENQISLAGIGKIDPARGLQGYLIKPVQRICRYPMMLKEIVKMSSPETYPFYDELSKAEIVMKRVADKVNEVQRAEENKATKVLLMENISDLKGMNPADWGDLLLHDKFPMLALGVEQIYNVYLLENLILCGKESTKEVPKSRRSKDLRTTTYDIKGQIYTSSISKLVDYTDIDRAIFELQVYWNESEESFLLKCRNIEQVELWRSRIALCSFGDAKLNSSFFGDDPRSLFTRRSVVIGGREQDGNGSRSRVLSMPPPNKILSRNGTELSQRVSSVYTPRERSSSTNDDSLNFDRAQPILPRRSSSFKPPSFIAPMSPGVTSPPPSARIPYSPIISPSPASSRISNTATSPPRVKLPKPPNSSPPLSALPMPPMSGLPIIPLSKLSMPPASPLPMPPLSTVPKQSLSALSMPPKSALPQPPSLAQSRSPTQLSPPRNVLDPPRSSLPSAPITIPKNVIVKESPPRGPPLSALPPTPTRTQAKTGLIKMKTHYGSDIFILAVQSVGVRYEEILEKIERKIEICGLSMPVGRRIKLKYKDEDGDYITINTDEDIEMAFDYGRRTTEKGSVTIMVE